MLTSLLGEGCFGLYLSQRFATPPEPTSRRLLQGFQFDEESIKYQYRTVFPGLQFTLAGVIGKPVSYYVVPAIRMVFVVISYL